MALFSYRGRNARGELVHGRLDGADVGAVADQLFNTGITPLEITAARESARSAIADWWGRILTDRVRPMDVMLFSRQMYTLLKAGVPILRALAGLEDSTQNRALKGVLQEIRMSLDSGRELATALHRFPTVFTPFYVSLIRVGEMTGNLDETFLRLFNHLEFEREMRERIKSALRYPTFVILAMAAALVVINLFVIPAFAKVYQGFKAQLPLMTRILIGFSDFMVASWPILLIGIIVAVVGFRAYIATRDGRYRWDKAKLSLPIGGKIVLKGTLSRFARGFALAYKSGVPVVQGLSVVAQVVDNQYVAHRIEQMRDGVERGESVLRTATTTGVFTPVALQMIAVGEETGELDGLLLEVAEMYEREVQYEVRTLSEQIEPLLIIGLGIIVLILALGVFLPIWELGQAAMKR